MNKNKKCKKYTTIGGQALIEGIMMRSPTKTVVVCRAPNGEIREKEVTSKSGKFKKIIMKFPFLRGAFGLIDSMILGAKALMIATDIAMEEQQTPEDETTEITKNAPKEKSKATKIFSNIFMALAGVVGALVGVFFFTWLPSFLFDSLNLFTGENISSFRVPFESAINIILFISYISIVALMPDIKRLFMYHGAEHMAIAAHEAKVDLTVENVRKYPRFHPRCGTSFLVLMIAVSLVVFMVLAAFIPWLTRPENRLWWISLRLAMTPIIIGFGYELIKIAGRFDNIFTRIISAPGMWVQRITTKKPDDDMLEVAICSLKAVLPNADSHADCKAQSATCEISNETQSAE